MNSCKRSAAGAILWRQWEGRVLCGFTHHRLETFVIAIPLSRIALLSAAKSVREGLSCACTVIVMCGGNNHWHKTREDN